MIFNCNPFVETSCESEEGGSGLQSDLQVALAPHQVLLLLRPRAVGQQAQEGRETKTGEKISSEQTSRQDNSV